MNYISAVKNHIPISSPFTETLLKKFEKEFSIYKKSRAAIQSSDHEKLSLDLISRIVQFRQQEMK